MTTQELLYLSHMRCGQHLKLKLLRYEPGGCFRVLHQPSEEVRQLRWWYNSNRDRQPDRCQLCTTASSIVPLSLSPLSDNNSMSKFTPDQLHTMRRLLFEYADSVSLPLMVLSHIWSMVLRLSTYPMNWQRKPWLHINLGAHSQNWSQQYAIHM